MGAKVGRRVGLGWVGSGLVLGQGWVRYGGPGVGRRWGRLDRAGASSLRPEGVFGAALGPGQASLCSLLSWWDSALSGS